MVILVALAGVLFGLAVLVCVDLSGLIPRPRGRAWWERTFIGRDRLTRAVAIVAVVSVTVPPLVVGILATTAISASEAGALPPARSPVGSGITQLYDANGAPIATFQQFTTYLPVTSGDIPAVLKKAVVASEDRRFYSHRGIDLKGILRAMWADLNGGGFVQGGSTIDQQYVRLVYGSSAKTLNRKLREAILAGRVDSELTKDQILTGYLNRVYFGGGAYGIGAASRLYFHKDVKDLTLSESALLAGILPAPTDYDPRVDPAGADARRQDVLDKMAGQGLITAGQAAAAKSQYLAIAMPGTTPPPNATVVYPLPAGETAYPWFVDYVRRYLIDRYGVDKVLQGGLQVYTSLDPRLQSEADASVAATLTGTPDQIDMAMVVVDPTTGLVRAMVGGRDYATSQVNAALGSCPAPSPGADLPICIDGGGTGRQPGSAFKPFTLATAFEQGLSADTVFNGPDTYTFPPGTCQGTTATCTVHNVESGGFGPITLRQATADSVNTVFAQLIQKVGVNKVAAMANRLGVTMINPDGRGPNGPYGPSLTLGTADVSPLDMAAAYGVFANGGLELPATPVVRVVATDGTVLEDNSSRLGTQVIPAAVANQVNDVLKDVVGYGTGTAANIGRPNGTAGKTGTTENFSDAWFVGYTPQLSTSVWMGNVTGRQPLVDIKGLPQVFGGTLPAQTWHAFMSAALATAPVENFVSPNPPPICASTGEPAFSSPTTSTSTSTSTSSTIVGLQRANSGVSTTLFGEAPPTSTPPTSNPLTSNPTATTSLPPIPCPTTTSLPQQVFATTTTTPPSSGTDSTTTTSLYVPPSTVTTVNLPALTAPPSFP